MLPYLTVYMKQLGLTPTETGLIYGCMPFITFFVRPFIGGIADKTKKHKLVLIVCILCTGVLYSMLLLTPRREVRSTRVVTAFECNTYDSYISDCNTGIISGNGELGSCPDKLRLPDFVDQYVKAENTSNIQCELSCHKTIPINEDLKVCMTNDIKGDSGGECENWDSTDDSKLKFSINLRKLLNDKITQVNDSNMVQTCENYDLKNITYNGTKYWQAVCNMEALFDCEVACLGYTTECEHEHFGKTFRIFFVIFLFGNIAFAPVLSLVDAIAYDMLGEKREFWGFQRLWGTVGFAIFAVGSGILTYTVSVNFTMSFFIFFGLTLLSSVVTYFLKFSENIHIAPVFQSTFLLLKSFKIVVFFVLITCFGCMNAVTEAFVSWYVILLGGNTATIGLCLLASCLPEIIMLFFSGVIIKKLGHMTCLCTGLFAYVVRFFSYSLITNPWCIIPVELVHCLCFGLTYAAASSYASMIAPEGTSATIQGLVGGLYFGFGK